MHAVFLILKALCVFAHLILKTTLEDLYYRCPSSVDE